jgi:valyl-tRNA synthetase
VWQRFGVGESIVVAAWPESVPALVDPVAEADFTVVQEIVSDIRQLQSALPAEFGKRVAVAERLRPAVEPWLSDVQRLTGAEVEFERFDDVRVNPLVPAGADTSEVLERVGKRLAEASDKLERKQRKLSNEGFIAKADPAIIQKERTEAAALETEVTRLQAQLARLGG